MEATAKRIVQRNLPLDVKYSLRGIVHGSVIDGDGTICDNCNAIISNVATIADESGKQFHVGLDCMKSLTLKPSLASEEMLESYNSFTVFLGKCNKPNAEMRLGGGIVYVQFRAANGRMQYGSGYEHQITAFINGGMEAFIDRYRHKLP